MGQTAYNGWDPNTVTANIQVLGLRFYGITDEQFVFRSVGLLTNWRQSFPGFGRILKYRMWVTASATVVKVPNFQIRDVTFVDTYNEKGWGKKDSLAACQWMNSGQLSMKKTGPNY